VNPSMLIRELRGKGVSLLVSGGRIIAEGPLDDRIRATIRDHKPALVEWIAGMMDIIRQCEASARLTKKSNPEASRAWVQDVARMRRIVAGECAHE